MFSRNILPIVITGLALLLPFGNLFPFDLKGNLTTAYYGLEGREIGGSEDRRNLFYQYISLRSSEIGTEALSFGANFRFRGDASDGSSDENRTHFYSLYFDVGKVLPAGLRFRLGRQFLYSGVGTGHLDGLNTRIDPFPWLALTAWAGTQVRYKPEPEVTPWDEAAMWGGRVLIRQKGGTRAGVSFAHRKRGGELERRLLGFDMSTPALPWSNVYFKLDMDLELDRLRNTTLRVNPRLEGPLLLDLEYSRRSPSFRANSFFGIINYKAYDEIRVLPVYRLENGVRLEGEYSYVRYKENNTHRVRGGLSWEQFSGGLLYRDGYAGGRLGMYARVAGDLPMEMEGLFRLDYAKYNLVEGGSLDSESLVAIFRITRNLADRADFSVELQEGRNPAFDSDFRVFAKLTYRFQLRR